jgi:nucleotide-binding universal stress UspA family protein
LSAEKEEPPQPPSAFPPVRILVPIDGSQNALRAIDVGTNLAKGYNAELLVINIIPVPGIFTDASSGFGTSQSTLDLYYDQQESHAKHFLGDAMDVVRKYGDVKVTTEVDRADKSIVEEIIDAALRNKTDLIVIGTRGLGGFRKLLQGSISSGVVTHAHCNVLVVR